VCGIPVHALVFLDGPFDKLEVRLTAAALNTVDAATAAAVVLLAATLVAAPAELKDAPVEELAIEAEDVLVEEATTAGADELTGTLPVQPSPGTATSKAYTSKAKYCRLWVLRTASSGASSASSRHSA